MLSHFSRVWLFATYGLKPSRLLSPWDSPGKNTGVGGHPHLQGIFPTQGSNLRLLHLLNCQADSLPLVPPRKPMNWAVISIYMVFRAMGLGNTKMEWEWTENRRVPWTESRATPTLRVRKENEKHSSSMWRPGRELTEESGRVHTRGFLPHLNMEHKVLRWPFLKDFHWFLLKLVSYNFCKGFWVSYFQRTKLDFAVLISTVGVFREILETV